eukprot:756247-Hanusia_phi.AAC.12
MLHSGHRSGRVDISCEVWMSWRQEVADMYPLQSHRGRQRSYSRLLIDRHSRRSDRKSQGSLTMKSYADMSNARLRLQREIDDHFCLLQVRTLMIRATNKLDGVAKLCCMHR